MIIKRSIFITLLAFSPFLFSKSQPLKVNESDLITYLRKSPPDLALIDINNKRLDLLQMQALNNFDTTLAINGAYINSKEKPLAAFSPTTRYASQFKISLNKNFQSGISLSPYIYSDQATNDFMYQGAKTGIGLDINMDLYKNFLGRTTKIKLEKIKYKIEQGKINQNIKYQSYSNNIRKLYWSIIANQEAIKISKQLLQGAVKLKNNSEKKFKNRIADIDEVYRNKSLVASRVSSITALNYKHEVLIENLKLLIPDLALAEIEVKQTKLKTKVGQIMACLSMISTSKEIPYEYTQYDDLIKLMEFEFNNDLAITKNYSKIDIKMIGNIKKNGSKLNGRSESFDDFKDDGRISYQLGFAVTMPLGTSKSKTMELEKNILLRTLNSHQLKMKGMLTTSHTQIKKSIKLLFQAMKSQQKNTNLLKKTLKTSKRKYNQARNTLSNLIIDENNYFRSNLIEIETKLKIIHVLLDYLSIFSQTPCEINIQLHKENA